MNERRVDKKLLIYASVGRLCCTIARVLLGHWGHNLKTPLDQLMGNTLTRACSM